MRTTAICHRLGLSADASMVDDEAVNINAIAPIAKVICFDTSYNRDCEGENIMRARDWDEVGQIIDGMR